MVAPGRVDADAAQQMRRAVDGALRDSPAAWSVLVADADGATLFDHESERVLPAASVAKLPLLLAAAVQMTAGALDPDELLARALAPVGDSGIWQHLRTPSLPAADVARLVGMVSDNEATNALLKRVGGPDEVMRIARAHGVRALTLHDQVRAERTPSHPPLLGEAAAAGCVDFWMKTGAASAADPAVAGLMRDWLRDGVDTSMVLAPVHLDPLAHTAPDRGWTALHKTGTDHGVRADTGVLRSEDRGVVYAALAHWTPDGDLDPHRDAVMGAMHAIGRAMRALLRPE